MRLAYWWFLLGSLINLVLLGYCIFVDQAGVGGSLAWWKRVVLSLVGLAVCLLMARFVKEHYRL